jgi:hypothetical protein
MERPQTPRVPVVVVDVPARTVFPRAFFQPPAIPPQLHAQLPGNPCLRTQLPWPTSPAVTTCWASPSMPRATRSSSAIPTLPACGSPKSPATTANCHSSQSPNTAGVAALDLLRHLGMSDRGIEMEIHKKMPFGSGLGSSAASAVAGAFAVNCLIGEPLTKQQLLPFAMAGEASADGAWHADNVGPESVRRDRVHPVERRTGRGIDPRPGKPVGGGCAPGHRDSHQGGARRSCPRKSRW